ITDSGADSTALQGNATGTGAGYGVEGTSLGAGGVVAWSVSPSDINPAATQYTGVYGFAPVLPSENDFGAGVWGDSPDVGVFGSGTVGTYGFGAVGVQGLANSGPGS